MTGFSRSTHTVRVKSNDKRFYADVEILDAVSFGLPNGFDICYKISKPNIVSPNIIDQTGDGNGKAGNEKSTRASHMVRVTSTANPAMFFDVEVCDAFTITGPNNADFCIKCPTPGNSVPAVVDNTDSGLTVAANEKSTRGQHVVKLLHQIGSGTAGVEKQQVLTDYTLTLLTDAISYSGPDTLGMPWQSEVSFGGPGDVGSFVDYDSGPWYERHALKFYNAAKVMNGALSISANTKDTTQYVEDPGTNQMVPPDVDPDTDPNIYVYFPQLTPGPAPTSKENTGGPFLGATPYQAKGVPGTKGGTINIPAIDMGPIWWLRALGCTDNVWFWFISPVQQPLAMSFFGDPPAMANPGWGYRGWTPLPSFPVTWILSVNYAIVGMGTYGAPDLVTAAGGTITGDLAHGGYITVNWSDRTIPYQFGLSTTWVVRGGLGVGLPLVAYTKYSYYMPFGAFDLVDGNKKDKMALATSLHLDTSIYTDYGGPIPNIWEVTGIPQPALLNPKKIWDPVTNPHKQPSLALAKQVAEKFRDNWNATASDLTKRCAEATPNGGIVGYPNTPPPVWHWALPYGGDSVATAQMFGNGWVPAVPQDVTVPATVPTIGVGQLDPRIWNMTPVIKDGTPPVPWSWTSYTLTTYSQNPLNQSVYDLALTLGTP
jgi:hypothetical protein